MPPERFPHLPAQAPLPGRTPAHTARRGFTLLELMVVMALISILAAIGAPSVTPALRREGLKAGTAMVLQFLASARAEAMSSRRCVRVRLLQGSNPAILVRERLNSYDCEHEALNASGIPLIDSAKTLWFETGRINVDPDYLTVSFIQAPGQADSPALDSTGDLRWRPTGRLYSSDTTVTNDDGALRLVHPKLPSAANFTTVIAESHGPLCAKDIGTYVSTGAGHALNCL
jgi:prepilin-type N-terminal cleavage/methylation domain-containing protein